MFFSLEKIVLGHVLVVYEIEKSILDLFLFYIAALFLCSFCFVLMFCGCIIAPTQTTIPIYYIDSKYYFDLFFKHAFLVL